MEGAVAHVLTDLYAFAATAVAAIVILATGFNRADAIATLVVVVLMLRAGGGPILAPPGGSSSRRRLPGSTWRPWEPQWRAARMSRRSHDLHIWEITTGMPAASAHILVQPREDCHAVRGDLEELLSHDYGITHLTLQVDHLPDSTTEDPAPGRRPAARVVPPEPSKSEEHHRVRREPRLPLRGLPRPAHRRRH